MSDGVTISHARREHIDTLLLLAEHGRRTMRLIGNTRQWVNGYPDRDTFMRDIEQSNSYLVYYGDKMVGTFAMLPSPEPTYQRIYEGQWLNDKPYLVIHRIASVPEAHSVLRHIIDYAFTHTDNVRIDTHRDNAIMRHLLTKLGFRYCGIIYLANGDERLAYQKTT